MKKALQTTLILISFIPLFFGLTGLILGAERWLPPEVINPGIDNQYRYLSGYYLSLVFMIWWIVPQVETLKTPLRLLVLAIFIGGLARVYSVISVGMPPPLNMAGAALELGSPILILWQNWVAKRA